MRPPGLTYSSPPLWVAHAARWRHWLGVVSWTSTLLGILAIVGAVVLGGPPQEPQAARGLCGVIAVACFIAAAATGSARRIASARVQVAEALDAERLDAERKATGVQSLFGAQGQPDPVAAALERLAHAGGWRQLLAVGDFLVVAAASAWYCWPFAGGIHAELALGVAALVLAFPALVVERHLALSDPRELPDAPSLASVMRLPVAACVLGGLGAILHGDGIHQGLWLERAALVALVATVAELLIRLAALWFLPPPPPELAGSFADSALARLLPWAGARRTAQDTLRHRFNIDLSQSWAIQFVRRTLGGVLIALAAACWLLTGITTLAIDERGVYERLGRPLSVLAPGLHLHLPWPFGAVRRVELGVIHDLSLGDEGAAALPRVGADAATPADYDRLWEVKHPNESTYLVPTGAAPQLVDGDIRVLYRVGLDDVHAQDAAYRVDNPDQLVHALAWRLLMRRFGVHTLDQALGEDRGALSAELTASLQRELDARLSGLEVTAVVVDAIHPPAGAAVAYQSVQASQIAAATDVAAARSDAVIARAQADTDAVDLHASAQAEAAITLSDAHIERNRFEADQASFVAYGDTIKFETWLRKLASSLPKGRLVVVDHRLRIQDGVFIDLRPPKE